MDYLDLDDCDYLDLDMLENPYGKRIGGGYETVLTGPGGRSHIKGSNGKPLCMQKANARDVRPSRARVVTCYRCIKIMGMQSNAPFVKRSLTTARGEKKDHLMVPGGRQGRMVADKKPSEFGEAGKAAFKRGPQNHPTQPWMTKRKAVAKTREERLREEGIALPPAYIAPAYATSVETPTLYVSPKRARSREAKQVRAAAAARALPPKQMVDAFGEPFTMDDIARMVAEDERMMYQRNPRRSAAQANAAAAMHLYHSGQASTLAEAWQMVRAGHYSHNPKKVHFQQWDEMTQRPARKSGVGRSDAAKAMQLYRSGAASSLAEAWQMVKGEMTRHYPRKTGVGPKRRPRMKYNTGRRR